MKLSAKITSEKGKPVIKCGNEFLKIEIENEKREPVAEFIFKPFGDKIEIKIEKYYSTLSRIEWNRDKSKM